MSNVNIDFDNNLTFEEIAALQGKGPIQDPQLLRGDFWPDDEPIEEFLAALREWRGHDRANQAA